MMALTRPRFSRPLRLEPISQQNTNRSNSKLRHSENSYFEQSDKTQSDSLPSLSPLQFPYDAKQIAKKILQEHDYDFIFRNSRPSNHSSEPKFTQVHRRKQELVERNSNILKQAESQSKPSKHRKEESTAERLLPDMTRPKRVSFAIPPLVGHGTSHVEEQKHELRFEKNIELSQITSSRLYQVTDQDHNTYSRKVCKQTLSHNRKVVRYIDIASSNKECSNNRLANKQTGTFQQYLRKSDKYQQSSLADKINNRRAKGYLVTHRLPKLSQKLQNVEMYSGILPFLPTQSSTLEKARQVLLEKMQNSINSTAELTKRRRVMFLPSLAAPCSEEFAIAMRRAHGKRYISSPAILDHVMQKTIPLRATASLLDAILRPPSTPTAA